MLRTGGGRIQKSFLSTNCYQKDDRFVNIMVDLPRDFSNNFAYHVDNGTFRSLVAMCEEAIVDKTPKRNTL